MPSNILPEQPLPETQQPFREKATDVLADILLALVWVCTIYLGVLAVL